MSVVYQSDYWIILLPHPFEGIAPQHLTDVEVPPAEYPSDWAEQKAKEWVAEEPECRQIIKSCGWAVHVCESFKWRQPALPLIEGCLVAHKGNDDTVSGLYLGVAAYGEFAGGYFDEDSRDAKRAGPDVPHSAFYDSPADLQAGE
jgi:hypothetical protein